jgi:hypothetical protein
MGSENVTGGDNQQETGEGIKPDPGSSETARRASPLSRGDEDIVRPAWRHAELGRNDLASKMVKLPFGSNKSA